MGRIDLDIDLEEYKGLGIEAIRAVLDDLEEGHLTAAAAERHILKAVAELIDAAVPTGPFDDLDDSVIEDAVFKAWEAAKDWLTVEPDELREKADKLEERIAKAKSKGRERVGIGLLTIEKAEERVSELRLRATAIETRDELGEED